MATGAAGDIGEVKDVNANVDEYFSAAGELVEQAGLVLGLPLSIATSAATIPASASNVEIASAVSVALVIPAASAVTAGHLLSIRDANGTLSSSATCSVATPASGGKIGAVAANTASTSAASYAFINSAYGSMRLISNGTNWNAF